MGAAERARTRSSASAAGPSTSTSTRQRGMGYDPPGFGRILLERVLVLEHLLDHVHAEVMLDHDLELLVDDLARDRAAVVVEGALDEVVAGLDRPPRRLEAVERRELDQALARVERVVE